MVRAAFLTFAALLASVAPAQMRMGGPQQMSIMETGAGYLMMPPVQKEIGLSPAVSKKITDRYLALIKEFSPGAAKPGGAQPNVNIQEVMKKTLQVQKDALALLSPAQKTRLKQISIQQLGPNAFLYPEVKKDLGLTDEQTRRISAIVQDGSMQMFKEMGSMKPTSNPNEAMKRSAEFAKKREAWNAKMLKESTKNFKADQLAKWKAMQGKPFKIDMASAMRGMQRAVGG